MNKYLVTALFACMWSTALIAQKLERTISSIHIPAINSLAITYDGGKALTAGSDNKATLWNLQDGSKIRSFAQEDVVNAVAFNNDQTLFATASKNMSIVTWDGATYKPRKILKGHTASVLSIAFDPFNNNLLSIAADGQVNLWDAGSGKLTQAALVKLDKTNISDAYLQFSTFGNYFALKADELICIYKTDGSLFKSFKLSATSKGKSPFDFSEDGTQLVFKNSNSEISIVNTESGVLAQTISGEFKQLNAVHFSPNKNILLLGKENGSVDFYSITDKKTINSIAAHTGTLSDFQMSKDGGYLVTVGADLSLKKWAVADLKLQTTSSNSGGKNQATISNINLIDENKNGLLDGGEKADLTLEVRNTGTSALYDVAIKINSSQLMEGLEIPASAFAGNIPAGTSKTISVHLKINANIATGTTNVKLTLQSGSEKLGEENTLLRTGSSANAGVAVKSFQFFSPSGKAAKGEPITMLLTLENITRILAERVEVKFRLPMGVSAIDKVQEVIPKLMAGEKINVSIQFNADKNFVGDSILIGLEITGVSYTNANDVRLILSLNKQINTTGDLLALTDKGPGAKPLSNNAAMDMNTDAVAIEKIRYVILSIGMNSYEGSWPKLGNAVNDAKAVTEELQKSYGFTVARKLSDKQATRENIIKEFEWLVDNLSPADNLVIFYSGHGEFKEALNKGFWVPIDATTNSTSNLISNSDIQTFLSSIPAKHTLLISDACFSGDIFRGKENISTTNNDKYYNRANSLMSREAITSGGIEPVMDGGKDGHSIFTYYLLKALRENGQKFVDAGQLFEAIKVPIVNNSDQAPKFSHIKNTGDEGGEFIFYKAK